MTDLVLSIKDRDREFSVRPARSPKGFVVVRAGDREVSVPIQLVVGAASAWKGEVDG